MSNYVLKYSRDDRVKYISHLDFIRTFHRTVRRAELEMSFSQGYNPHPIMTVAMPLSVGITSDCEYMKIGFEGDYSEEEIQERINKSFPAGFCVLAVKRCEGKAYDFARLDRAIYEVELECENADKFDADKFMSNEKLEVIKKSKSGEKQADIRPYIYKLSAEKVSADKMKLKMCVAAGNNYNLKADTVISAMDKYTPGLNPGFAAVHRAKILAGDEELI